MFPIAVVRCLVNARVPHRSNRMLEVVHGVREAEKLDNPARRAGLAGRAPPPAAARGEARGEAKPDDKPAEERYVNKVAVSKASKARSRYHRQRKSR